MPELAPAPARAAQRPAWLSAGAGAQFVRLCEEGQEGGRQRRGAGGGGGLGGQMLLQMFDSIARYFASGRAPSRCAPRAGDFSPPPSLPSPQTSPQTSTR